MKRALFLAWVLFSAACAKPPVQHDIPVPPAFAPPPIISPFGARNDGEHYGIDIRVPIGTPVLAAAPGMVLWIGEGEISGKAIILQHGERLATFYFHLSTVSVRKGIAVTRGQVIGLSGQTGNATTPHLHFAVCHARNAECRRKLPHGWVNPVETWVDLDRPCFHPGRIETNSSPARLTYPVPCRAA